MSDYRKEPDPFNAKSSRIDDQSSEVLAFPRASPCLSGCNRTLEIGHQVEEKALSREQRSSTAEEIKAPTEHQTKTEQQLLVEDTTELEHVSWSSGISRAFARISAVIQRWLDEPSVDQPWHGIASVGNDENEVEVDRNRD